MYGVLPNGFIGLSGHNNSRMDSVICTCAWFTSGPCHLEAGIV
jgi:hypothetical protein